MQALNNENLLPVFQVSEVNELVNQHLSLLGEITIEGELSRWDLKNQKLLFGAIKDNQSSLDLFSLPHLIRNYRQFEPGMVVQLSGTVGLYKTSSKFRFFITRMTPVGEGALQLAYEKLKQQLISEGLFASERKRPIPEWPQNIGLITAKNSSAYQDLVKILNFRMAGLTLKVLPVVVQGREAVPSILRAFSVINENPQPFDVIILARGGGSLEDLQAFNDEDVCRAVYSCKIPVVSAVGHEDNWSLTDYVADLRASTPSNAAELVVKDRREIKQSLIHNLDRCRQFLLSQLSRYHRDLDHSIHVSNRALKGVLTVVNSSIAKLHVIRKIQIHQVDTRRTVINTLMSRNQAYLNHVVSLKKSETNLLTQVLLNLDHQLVLKRGFSITRDVRGKVLTEVSALQSGDLISSELASGSINSVVRKVRKK